MFFHWFYDTEADELLYKLMFTCASQPISLSVAGVNGSPCLTQNSTILYTVDSDAPQLIPANTWITRIAIMFTKEWLEENFPDASFKITEIVKLMGKKHLPAFITEDMGHAHYNMVNDMAKEMDKEIFPVIHIKTKSLVLLNEFLNNLKDLEVMDFLKAMQPVLHCWCMLLPGSNVITLMYLPVPY